MVKVSKNKQKETLKKMKQTRHEDMVFLRQIATQKLQWAKDEKQKGLDKIKEYEDALEDLRNTVMRLNGYIVACKELVEAKNEK